MSKTLQLLKSLAELPFHLAAMQAGLCCVYMHKKQLIISPCFSVLCQALWSDSLSSSSGWKRNLSSQFPANSWDLAPPSPSEP